MSYKDNKTILFDFAIDKNVDSFVDFVDDLDFEGMHSCADAIRYLIERIRLADAEIEELKHDLSEANFLLGNGRQV